MSATRKDEEKMNKKHAIKYLLGILAAWLPMQVQAGGIFLYEISSADTRLASAGWSARAEDPTTLFTNPAGMTRLCGKQAEFGIQGIFAHVHFDPDLDTSVEGDEGDADIILPSGSFFYVHPYNERLTFGIGNLGYFGADLVYNHDWVGRYYVQKTLLEGISLVPAVAYRVNDQWSIGTGVNIMYGFLKQRTAVRNLFDPLLGDGYFNLHDNRFGFGAIIGLLYEPSCQTRFGIQYLSPIKLDFHAKPKFHAIGPVLNTVLSDIGIIGSSLDLHVTVPQSVMLSVYHNLNPCWSIMGNIGWQQWSRFERVTISLDDLNNRSLTTEVDYQDTWHAAIGAEWYYRSCLTFSGGLAYDSSAISTSNRPLDFPIGEQWRLGTGVRWAISENLIVDLSSELLWQGDLDADVSKPIAGEVSGTFQNTYTIFVNSNLIYLF
jgi:long-chain fatty acid transport protein